MNLTAAQWFMVAFVGSGAIALILGIAISADEYLTEKFYESGSKGDRDGKET